MRLTLYGKPDCPWCDKAKELLEQHKFPYEYHDINTVDREHLLTMIAPGAKTVPIVLVDGKWIGGYTDLDKWVESHLQSVKQLRQKLHTDAVEVTFYKQTTGERRVMNCTTNIQLVPAEKMPKSQTTAVAPDSLFRVFDTDKQGWRSFSAVNVIEWK